MATIKDQTQILDDGTLTYDVVDGRPTNHRYAWNLGSPMANREGIKTKLTTARSVFHDNYTAWGTMTAAQKDNANRQAQRAISNLIGYVLEDMSDPGD